MANQTPIQSVLDEARWASRILSGKRSDINVHLVTFPGVVGGVFHAQIIGLKPDAFGQVEVAIICTGFDSDNSSDELNSSGPTTCFQEIESLSIQSNSFEIKFRIPFEAQATEEGATWHLSIHLGNGATEIFEVPVCRTPESNPEITAVQIAATGPELKQHEQRKWQKTSNKYRSKSYTMTNSNGELNLRLPARTPGRVAVLAKGLGIFAGLWGAMLALIYWFSKGAFEPMLVFGLLLSVMLILIVFMLFGVSYSKLNTEKLITTHKLFGLPLYWTKTNRCDLVGFSTTCLGSTPSPTGSQLNYMITAKTKNSTNVFISLTTFNQNDARILAGDLNEFLRVGQS